jgi:hypothetical protein
MGQLDVCARQRSRREPSGLADAVGSVIAFDLSTKRGISREPSGNAHHFFAEQLYAGNRLRRVLFAQRDRPVLRR